MAGLGEAVAPLHSERHGWRIPGDDTWHLVQGLLRGASVLLAGLCPQPGALPVSEEAAPEPPIGDYDKPQCPDRDFAQRQVKGGGLPGAPRSEVLVEVCMLSHQPAAPSDTYEAFSPPSYPTVICPMDRNLTFAEVSLTLLVVKESHTITFPS